MVPFEASKIEAKNGPQRTRYEWLRPDIWVLPIGMDLIYRNPMFYVYLLRSVRDPKQTYVGFTEDLKQRLAAHNAGKALHTKKFRPWLLETYLAFANESTARDFERYLKTASGKAFARKRLRSDDHKC